jgi:hypothetical protein
MSGTVSAIGNLFSPPKADSSAIAMQQKALEEQRAAVTEQQRQNDTREADTKRREDASRRARSRAGRDMLLFDEVGVAANGAAPTQKNLGAG